MYRWVKIKMKKQDVIKVIENLKIDLDEFWILSSSALVMRDLFEAANDVDIAVTEKGLEQLKENYELKKKDNGWYIVNDDVECIVDKKEDFKIEKCGKYNLQSLECYFQYLKNSNRGKDKIKYDIVRKVLSKR